MPLPRLLLETLAAGLATTLATGLGAVPFFFVPRLSERYRAAFLAAAAGMMTTASVLQIVGEAARRTPGYSIWQVGAGLFVGALFFMVSARWVRENHGFDVGGLRRTGGAAALLIVAAMTLHSVPEGAAIGVAYGTAGDTGSTAFGLSVAIALAVHNIPEGVAITVALRSKGVSTWACMGWAVLSSVPQTVGAPPAAAAVWMFQPLLPAGLGFAAGAMMYLVVDELLPDAYSGVGRNVSAIAFMTGLLVMVVIGRLVGIN